MFLNKLKENNPKLIDYAFKANKDGLVIPDTYMLDLDVIKENAKSILDEANKYNVRLYFMLKQIGRNPIVAKALMDLGYAGAVCVDYKEALCMIDNDIKIGNVGHLEQIPTNCLKKIISAKPEVITVYSLEKIIQINEVAKSLNINQGLSIRLTDDDSKLYSGQVAGFSSNDLNDLIKKINELDNVYIKGLTVFPALLFDDEEKIIKPTENMNALKRGMDICKKEGLDDLLINVPSCTCTNSISLISSLGGNNGEPGHGLTGTSPLHVISNQPERIGYCYISEISHNYKDKSYCYGGGEYRRGHMENVLVGKDYNSAISDKVSMPSMDSIDYHFELSQNHNVGDTCVMCFRTQMFTTRSNIVVVEGLSKDEPKILGTYDPLGRLIGENFK